jgi:hypothetical protein
VEYINVFADFGVNCPKPAALPTLPLIYIRRGRLRLYPRAYTDMKTFKKILKTLGLFFKNKALIFFSSGHSLTSAFCAAMFRSEVVVLINAPASSTP